MDFFNSSKKILNKEAQQAPAEAIKQLVTERIRDALINPENNSVSIRKTLEKLQSTQSNSQHESLIKSVILSLNASDATKTALLSNLQLMKNADQIGILSDAHKQAEINLINLEQAESVRFMLENVNVQNLDKYLSMTNPNTVKTSFLAFANNKTNPALTKEEQTTVQDLIKEKANYDDCQRVCSMISRLEKVNDFGKYFLTTNMHNVRSELSVLEKNQSNRYLDEEDKDAVKKLIRIFKDPELNPTMRLGVQQGASLFEQAAPAFLKAHQGVHIKR